MIAVAAGWTVLVIGLVMRRRCQMGRVWVVRERSAATRAVAMRVGVMVEQRRGRVMAADVVVQMMLVVVTKMTARTRVEVLVWQGGGRGGGRGRRRRVAMTAQTGIGHLVVVGRRISTLCC